MAGKKIKYIEQDFFRILMILSTLLIILALGLIIISILVKGLPALSWDMILKKPGGGFYFGKEGGIANSIIGSLYLAVGSTIFASAIGIPVALYMNVNLVKRQKFAHGIRFLLDILWGIPSIVYGAFGFVIMIAMGLRVSLLAGIIVVGFFILPIMIRGIDEGLKTIPRGLLESSLSLGATNLIIAFRIYLKQSMPVVVTSVLLSFGRAIGDAAAVMFTTGFTDSIPTSLTQPAATLPLAIFYQLSSPIPEVKARAYASAVVLIFIVLVISIITRILNKRFIKNTIK
jgi:phosphate transport system permease protein